MCLIDDFLAQFTGVRFWCRFSNYTSTATPGTNSCAGFGNCDGMVPDGTVVSADTSYVGSCNFIATGFYASRVMTLGWLRYNPATFSCEYKPGETLVQAAVSGFLSFDCDSGGGPDQDPWGPVLQVGFVLTEPGFPNYSGANTGGGQCAAAGSLTLPAVSPVIGGSGFLYSWDVTMPLSWTFGGGPPPYGSVRAEVLIGTYA